MFPAGSCGDRPSMSLRSHRVLEPVTLPDGREVVIDVGVARDPYIARRDMETVSVELRSGTELLAVLNTLLEPDDDSEARALARDIAAGLASGEIEPTAEAIEPLADRGG
jgi:hypothetical protein